MDGIAAIRVIEWECPECGMENRSDGSKQCGDTVGCYDCSATFVISMITNS